jgi:hypothetical protein
LIVVRSFRPFAMKFPLFQHPRICCDTWEFWSNTITLYFLTAFWYDILFDEWQNLSINHIYLPKGFCRWISIITQHLWAITLRQRLVLIDCYRPEVACLFRLRYGI